eukprot:340258-Amphidinium_carterae.1
MMACTMCSTGKWLHGDGPTWMLIMVVVVVVADDDVDVDKLVRKAHCNLEGCHTEEQSPACAVVSSNSSARNSRIGFSSHGFDDGISYRMKTRKSREHLKY